MSQAGVSAQGNNGPMRNVPANPKITEKRHSIMAAGAGGGKGPSSGGNVQKPTTTIASRKKLSSIQENTSTASNQLSSCDTPSQKDEDDDIKRAMKKFELEEKRKQMREDMKKKKKTSAASEKNFTVEIFTSAGRAVINEPEEPYDMERKSNHLIQENYQSEPYPNYIIEKKPTRQFDSPLKLQHKAQSVEILHYPNEYDQVIDMPLKKGSSNKKSKRPQKDKQDHSEPPRHFDHVQDQPQSPRVVLGFGEGTNKSDQYLNQDYSGDGIEIYVKGAPPPRKPAAALFPQIEAPKLKPDFRKKEERHEFIVNDDNIPVFETEKPSQEGYSRMTRQPSFKDGHPMPVAVDRPSFDASDRLDDRDQNDDEVKHMVSIDRTKKILKFLPEEPRTDHGESMDECYDGISYKRQPTDQACDADNDFGIDLESVSRIDTKKNLEDQLSSSYAIINVTV